MQTIQEITEVMQQSGFVKDEEKNNQHTFTIGRKVAIVLNAFDRWTLSYGGMCIYFDSIESKEELDTDFWRSAIIIRLNGELVGCIYIPNEQL